MVSATVLIDLSPVPGHSAEAEGCVRADELPVSAQKCPTVTRQPILSPKAAPCQHKGNGYDQLLRHGTHLVSYLPPGIVLDAEGCVRAEELAAISMLASTLIKVVDGTVQVVVAGEGSLDFTRTRGTAVFTVSPTTRWARSRSRRRPQKLQCFQGCLPSATRGARRPCIQCVAVIAESLIMALHGCASKRMICNTPPPPPSPRHFERLCLTCRCKTSRTSASLLSK